jgi:hypothetical protein
MAETPPSGEDGHVYSLEQMNEIIANRVSIEQAKGVLMFVYDIDADAAFDMLRRRARTTRVKLLLLAKQLMHDVVALTPDERLDLRSACNNLLLNVHERVRDEQGSEGHGC